MDVSYTTQKQLDAIKRVVRENNFSLEPPVQQQPRDVIILKNVAFILSVTVILSVIYAINQFFDLNAYLPDTSNLSYAGAFLIGVIASLSTCLAITGGIVIGF